MRTSICKLFLIIFLLGLQSCFGTKEILEFPLNTIQLTGIPDGEYYGKYGKFRWFCHVIVDVKSGKIDTIRVVKTTNQLKSIHKEMIRRVMNKQSVDVDAVSGATITSKVFLNAVDDALSRKK
jgi:uncharacterized protein with FMN-binding domain